MKYFVDECVGCPTWMGCMGSACPNRNVPYYRCDICGEDELNEEDMEDEHICKECARKENEEEGEDEE